MSENIVAVQAENHFFYEIFQGHFTICAEYRQMCKMTFFFFQSLRANFAQAKEVLFIACSLQMWEKDV